MQYEHTPYYVMRIGKLPVIPYYRPGNFNIAKELGERALDGKGLAFSACESRSGSYGENLIDAVDNTEGWKKPPNSILFYKVKSAVFNR